MPSKNTAKINYNIGVQRTVERSHEAVKKIAREICPSSYPIFSHADFGGSTCVSETEPVLSERLVEYCTHLLISYKVNTKSHLLYSAYPVVFVD
jgi:hypothetical protein